MSKIGVVSRVALNANSPALLGHSEHEGPPLLWVEVCVCQNEKTLVLAKLNVLLKVLEDLPRMELLHLGVTANTGLHYALVLKLI